MPRLPRLFFILSFLFFSVASTTSAAPRLSAESLQTLLEEATESFAQGNFTAAADRFARIETNFSEEDELQDESFLRRFLPVKGHAEFAAGRPIAAAETFSRFVDRFPSDPQHADALYALALTLQENGSIDPSLERFEEFEKTYPHHPLKNLAEMQRIRLLLALEKPEEALGIVDSISENEKTNNAADRARLQIARYFLKEEQPLRAAKIVLAHRWDLKRTPEIASLSLTAFELGDQLQTQNKFSGALRLYRLVLPYETLRAELTERIAELTDRQTKRSGEHPFIGHDRGILLGRLKQQQKHFNKSEDYTDSLLLRRGQMFLFIDRPHEAWLLFEQLALDENVSPQIRQDAHYRWAMAASALEEWEAALAIARYFLSEYPESPLAPETLSLIAQAHQEQRRYPEAIDILEDLRKHFPTHPLAQRWSFTLGFNKTALEKYPEARTDFQRAKNDFPESPLQANAGLWHALTFFFEKDYENALAEFDSLAAEYSSHRLEGEISYRRAATLYAMRDYERAAIATTQFIDDFPHHPRFGEGLVLLGDIQMGAARLDEALSVFRKIPPEMENLYLYGLFQQGKILRAQEDFDEMIALFSDYIESGDGRKPRISEALYWIGWAYAQKGNSEKTIPLLLKALNDFGNDPDAREIGSILNLLAPLHRFLDSPENSFAAWLETERKNALESGSLTYFSRLTLQLSDLLLHEGFPNRAEQLYFEITARVRPKALDPEALGKIGRFLAEKNLQNAEEYFSQLLERFPNAPERAFAYHGLGVLAFQRNEFDTALRWLRLFQKETPGHPLAGDVFQFTGETLLALEQYQEANDEFEKILELRTLRGRPHAKALIGLAQTWAAAGDHARAIAYYQRIYTMHRAQTDLVGSAYAASSALFEKLGDLDAAHRTLVEMLSIAELADLEITAKAQETAEILAARLEKETSLNSEP
ncbi:MAG TPA: tetratricopeptide repeat protein [Opitutales bacterium]|nr:tetratricopeptide repeat protein [Opitutales bacterium]